MAHPERWQPTALIVTVFMMWAFVFVGSIVTKERPAKSNVAKTTEQDLPLTLHVSPRFGWVGAPVQAVVRVTPNIDNRLLRITVNSADYFRSSDVTLDGADAARTHTMPLRSLPAGTYSVVATVYGTEGERARSAEKLELLAGRDPVR